jgi:hypothetical protein
MALVSWRVGGPEICQRSYENRRELGVYSLPIYERQKRVSGLCTYHVPEEPAGQRVTVSISNEEPPRSLASYRLRHITVADAAGQTTNFLAGDAAPLRWFPMPVMGCGLNSAAAAWECSGGFARQKRRTLGADGEFSLVPVIAKGLGLSASPASERRDAIVSAPPPNLEAIAAEQVARQFAVLDKTLVENPQKITSPDVEALSKHPEMLAPRAEMMVQAWERSINGKPSHTANDLQRLIARLPQADFDRVGPQVLRIFEENSDRHTRAFSSELLARLGDVGIAALPTLELHAKESNDYIVAGSLLGICRIGAPAVAAAPALVDAVLSDQRMKIVGYQAAFVALRRLGRSDLAERIRTRAPFNRSEDFKPWEGVTPDSPADVCVKYSEAERNRL